MKIAIRVKLRARKESVEKEKDGTWLVAVKALPVAGKANDAVIKAIAKYFGVAPLRVRIVSGFSSRRKMMEIM